MKSRLIALAGVMGMVLGATSTAFSDESQGSVYGKIYSDWYYDASNNSAITQKSQVEIGRVYLGYKYKINDNFTTDALLDVQRVDPATAITTTSDSTKHLTGLSYKIDDRYFAYLKTAYMAWKNVLPYTTLSLGQIPYFAFDAWKGSGAIGIFIIHLWTNRDGSPARIWAHR